MSSELRPAPRLQSVDALRGGVMIVMALDHVRDFFHRDAARFSPTDLSGASAELFLTRWITHFCLPVFMFTAGVGVFLWWHRGKHSRNELSRFLLTRGAWFIFLELTAMQFAFNFNFSANNLVLLLILWIFGICMILLAGLVYLPWRWLAVLSIAGILLHNCLDGIDPARFGRAAWAWQLLHQPGVFLVGNKPFLVTYTILPWLAVMAGGFCFARIYTLEPARRRRILLWTGSLMIAAFFVIRVINHYGDPAPWSVQKSAFLTALSFLNCTKYPGSLDFLLMTLGPAMLLLHALERCTFRSGNPLIVFGRVPFFYFLVHFYAIHALAVLMAILRYGSHAFTFVWSAPPSISGSVGTYPADFGYNLGVVYLIWIALVAALYPVCRWYARYKSGHTYWWLSYL